MARLGGDSDGSPASADDRTERRNSDRVAAFEEQDGMVDLLEQVAW